MLEIWLINEHKARSCMYSPDPLDNKLLISDILINILDFCESFRLWSFKMITDNSFNIPDDENPLFKI